MLNYPGDIDITPEPISMLAESNNVWLRALGILLALVHVAWLVFLMLMMGAVFWVFGQALR